MPTTHQKKFRLMPTWEWKYAGLGDLDELSVSCSTIFCPLMSKMTIS